MEKGINNHHAQTFFFIILGPILTNQPKKKKGDVRIT